MRRVISRFTLKVLNFAGIKFRDSQIFLKTDFSRVLNFANLSKFQQNSFVFMQIFENF